MYSSWDMMCDTDRQADRKNGKSDIEVGAPPKNTIILGGKTISEEFM